jgi:hypothetical protein
MASNPSHSEPPPAPVGRPRLRRLPDAGGVLLTPDLVAGCGWSDCPDRSPPDDLLAAVLIVRPDGSVVYVSLAEYQRLDAAAVAIHAHNNSLPRPGVCRCGCDETILAWKSPHVGRYCANCGRWLGWVVQTPEVLAAVGPEPAPNTLC